MSPSLILDFLITAALVLYLIDGYRRGFLLLAVEVLGIFLAFYLAALWAQPAGQLLAHYINLPAVLQKSIGFLVLWFAIQTLYVPLSNWLYPLIPSKVRDALVNRVFGVVPSVVKGVITVAIILTLFVALPIQNQFKPIIANSRLGEPLVKKTQELQQRLTRRYHKELSDTLALLTNTPLIPKLQESGESLQLHYTATNVSVDEASEQTMLTLVNQERAKVGLRALRSDTKARDVARAHALDMFARGYFSHDTPESKDPFDRMHEAGISFLAAGENLALAPTVELAHTGLMNSPKHRDNILYTDFGHAGIGVIDGGIYGKMFVQEFTD